MGLNALIRQLGPDHAGGVLVGLSILVMATVLLEPRIGMSVEPNDSRRARLLPVIVVAAAFLSGVIALSLFATKKLRAAVAILLILVYCGGTVAANRHWSEGFSAECGKFFNTRLIRDSHQNTIGDRLGRVGTKTCVLFRRSYPLHGNRRQFNLLPMHGIAALPVAFPDDMGLPDYLIDHGFDFVIASRISNQERIAFNVLKDRRT